MVNGVIAASNNMAKKDSYLGKDGILYCNICHTPKQQKWLDPFANKNVTVGIVCDCVRKRNETEKKLKIKEEIDKKRKICFENDKKFAAARFENNDNSQPKILKICKDYVNNFLQMKKEAVGILFHGDVGTGKSNHAANIANALLDNQTTVLMSNIIDLIIKLQNFETREYAIEEVSRVGLLIIDDLGAERSGDYNLEQVYRIINTRYNAGLPIIFTTNLSLEEIETPSDFKYKRIYDRVDEMTPIKLRLAGESKRKAERDGKRKSVGNVFYGKAND